MAFGGDLIITAEKEADMGGTKKTKGAWVIHVRGRSSGKGAGAGHDKCDLGSSEGIPCHNEQKDSTFEKGE